ncbi:MAG: DUF389 domain-containing protein [Desulfobacterales bacterium]|jgi:uncharacterized membrane protein
MTGRFVWLKTSPERVSSALPGVAIATAIVPPLSNTGLCLALGADSGAVGSFTLFVANFFAIIVVGALTFAAAGVLRISVRPLHKKMAQNFLFAVVGFVFVNDFTKATLKKRIETIPDIFNKKLPKVAPDTKKKAQTEKHIGHKW